MESQKTIILENQYLVLKDNRSDFKIVFLSSDPKKYLFALIKGKLSGENS
jgi:hypothetical protein